MDDQLSRGVAHVIDAVSDKSYWHLTAIVASVIKQQFEERYNCHS